MPNESGAVPPAAGHRRWNRWLPAIALVVAAVIRLHGGGSPGGPAWLEVAVPLFAIALLLPTVIVVLHHAETAAATLGEPFGTLLLTLAVTTIEVAIIVSLMLNGENNPTLARESVFSVVMMATTGGVGACLVVGALRHHEQDLRPQGTSTYLAVLLALSVILLVLPNYTISTDPGAYTAIQLGFVSLLSGLLYLAFLYIQSVRHRDDFVDAGAEREPATPAPAESLAVSIVALLAGLVAVVLLAERFAVGVESGLHALGVQRPDAIIGALLAALLLFPELLSALRAARANQLQRSINIVLGSALATIGLTIPAVAAVTLFTGRDLILGLPARDEVLLILALALGIVSFGTGRTNVLTGLVHLVVWSAYLMLLFVP